MAKIDKVLEQAKAHFEPGEEAISTVLGAYETKIMGRDSVRNGIFVATNKRLVFFAKKLTGFDLEIFPYKNISSIEMGKNLMGHHISFFTSGNKASMKWISVGNVQKFVKAVKGMIASAASSSDKQASTAPMDLLEKLGKLREAGVVTEKEFELKKAEILARL